MSGGLNIDIDVKRVSAEQLSRTFPVLLSTRFRIFEELGQGSTGVVRRAKRIGDDREVALKSMRTTDPEFRAIVQREYSILRGLQHPHIIEAHDFLETASCLVLVLEHFAGLTLVRAVRQADERCLVEAVSKSLCRMMFEAVDYLHQHQIIHRDVKASNILVSDDLGNLKLIDFNSAGRLVDGAALTMTGTRQYMAPEVLRGESPSEVNDVWAAGLCLYFMLSGRLPLWCHEYADLAKFASAVAAHGVVLEGQLEGQTWRSTTGPCKAFLRSCLEVEKTFRPTFSVLLGHEWFESHAGNGEAPRPHA